jgi:diguanylate cyclase (GGDEF)-like protein/PAS domain S-box-containing protein
MMDIAPRPHQIPQAQDEKTSGVGAVLRRLSQPAASIHEPERRRHARLLSALMATLSLLGFLSTVLVVFTVHQPSDLYIVAGATLVMVFATLLSRTQHYNLSALLMVITVSGTIFSGETFNPDAGKLYFLILGVLVASLFLSRRDTTLIMMATFIGIGLLGASHPVLPVHDLLGVALAVLCVGVLGIVGITIRQRDLEEIQRQSISLRESEERFRLISYATNDVVWDWDLRTDAVWRNKSAQRLFGFSEDQISAVIGWWEGQIHPDERKKVVTSMHEAINSGENFWSQEYRFCRADGSYIYIFDRAYILHDEKNGKPVRAIGAMMDITARRQAEEVLRQESVHDPLTGLFNRRYMEEMLEREINRAERTRQQISIIMLDIDHFKQINDTFGHAAGDALLHTLGILLLKHIRETDIACRYGGDEFILILPGAPLVIGQQRAEEIRNGARSLLSEPYGDSIQKFTLSLGIAVFPDQGSTRETIFAAADAALYTAKEAGRNQIAVAKI